MRLHAEPVEMDAAAAAADDLPLPALFDGASRLHGLASSSALDQDGIRTGVDLLRCCDRMVSKLGLFSPNDDVATANLKYLLVPYYLAEMTQKIAQEDRISVLKASQDHLKEFIALCQVLELIPEDELELSRQKQPDTMANRRAQKIARFKRQQAAETKLQEIRERKERRGCSLRAAALSAPTEAGEEDDLEDDGEEEREAWLATISLALCKAFDLLDMLKKEEEMLLAVKERKAKEKAKGEKVGEEAVEYEDDFDDTPLPAVRRCADVWHEEEDESDRGGNVPFPSTASNDEAVNEVSASQVLEKEAAEGGEVAEAKKGAEPRKALDGRITKALAALLLSPNREARMVVFQSYKRLKAHNDLNELLIDDIIKCFCQEIRTNKDLTSCFLDFLICIAKETSFYKECNSQGSRDFEGRLCALAGSVLDIVDYIRNRKDLKELISYEQIAHVLATWTPLCVSMSWEDLQKHPILHKTLTKLLKYNWSTTMKGSSCSQSDVKEMELVKEISKQNCMISELRQSMVVMEKAIKQNNAAPVDDSALALRELERQVKALQIENEEMKDRLQLMEDRNIEMKDRLQEAEVYRKEAEVYRKKLLNENLDLKGNIRVFCRVRPMIVNNIRSDALAQHIEYATSIEARGRGIIVNKKAFLFDKVFHHTTSQTTVFDEVSNLVQSALDGYKVCILSYGQTGSGKTYTMIGSEEEKGIIPRSLEKIFECESAENKSCKYSFKVSIFEIYNDKVKDLLSGPSDLLSPRKLRPNGETGQISDLDVREIFSSQHALDLLATATNNRSVAETTMNEHSSRSHLFFNIKITEINEGQKVEGLLSLVDLAGSERANKDNNHDRVTEGNKINVSLTHLRTVIQAIKTKGSHITYRNCCLTLALKEYLEGDSKMLMLANITQEKSCVEETVSTLNFASDANATNIKYLHTCAKGDKSVAKGDKSVARHGKGDKSVGLHPSKRKVGFR